MAFFKNATLLRKTLFGLGAVTFVAGAGLLVFAGLSALGGGDDRPEPPIVDVADILSPTPTHAPTEGPTPAPTPVPAPPLGEAGYTMIIDKIGVNNPVEVYGLDEEAVPVVPEGDNAADVIAWYNFSARPGTGSNAVFAGHVTWFGAAVFYNLTSIVAGDEIKLLGVDGTELLYRVSDVFQVYASDPDSLNVMKNTDKDVLTIITCDGVFTADPNDHDAGGSYDRRLVVRADLQSVTQDAVVAAGG